MTTWRSSLAATTLLLTGCAEISMPAFRSPERVPKPSGSAELARGAVKLVAPEGYCVDPAALRPRFAMLARCDMLGGAATGEPLALVTVSLTPGEVGDAVPGDFEVLDRQDAGELSLARLRGTGMAEGFSEIHWRGTAQIGRFAVGLAAYGPEGGAIAGADGAKLLTRVMSGLKPTPSRLAPAASPLRRGGNKLLKRLTGLFD